MTRALLILVLALAACAPTPGPSLAVCIPLGDVSAAQQSAAADAIAASPPDAQAALLPVLLDWEHMRDADRACIANSNPPATSGH